MRILSLRVGFTPDHSTTTYRYTTSDKATAWHAFWEGLPAVCAEGQVRDLTLFSPDPLPDLDLQPSPIHRFEPGDYYLTFDEWWSLVAEHHDQLLYAYLVPGYGAEGVISLSPSHLLVNDHFERDVDGYEALRRLSSGRLSFFCRYGRYDDGMWEFVMRSPTSGIYTLEPGVERHRSRRWHIVELQGLVDAPAARRKLTPLMERIVRITCDGLFISGPPQNGGLAFNATTGRSHIFFNFEVDTDERAMHATVQAMEQAEECRFFYQDSDF